VCGQKVGHPNVGYYQPVGEALSAYGATLVTQ
jgi:streptogrisin C